MPRMSFTHDELMSMVPYGLADPFQRTTDSIGAGVMFREENGTLDPSKSELIACYGAINPKAGYLVLASPMLYQSLAHIASLMRSAIDELDDLQSKGLISKEVAIGPVRNMYEVVESQCLGAMQAATLGLDQVSKSFKGDKG